MSDRCTGGCCKDFSMSLSPEELKNQEDDLEDGEQLNGMLIYLGFYKETTMFENRPDPVHHYTCKNFDRRNCRIYEHRPNMCRRFPNGLPCSYKDCTWDAVAPK